MPPAIRTAILAALVCGSFISAQEVESAIGNAFARGDRGPVDRVVLDAKPVSNDFAAYSVTKQLVQRPKDYASAGGPVNARFDQPTLAAVGRLSDGFAFASRSASQGYAASLQAFPNASGLSSHPVFGSAGHPVFGTGSFLPPSGLFGPAAEGENGLDPITNPLVPVDLAAPGPQAQPQVALGPQAVANMESAVPEPSSWALFLVGFAGLGLALRRGRSGLRETLVRPGPA